MQTRTPSLSSTVALFLPGLRARVRDRFASVAFDDLERGDYRAALGNFRRLLASIGPKDQRYLGVKLGEICAWAWVDEGGWRAIDEFIVMSKAAPNKVTQAAYRQVALALLASGNRMAAIAMLDAARQVFPDDLAVERLGYTIRSEAKRAGDAEALGALRSLGYIAAA